MAIGMLVVPTGERLIKSLDAGNKIAQAHADGHRQEDPQRQVAVEER